MAKLTEAQKRFIQLDIQKEEVKKFYAEYDKAVNDVVAESGVGAFFQDEAGTVYQTAIPKGTFVDYKPYTITHTKRGDEVKGSLALKTAQEAGFDVK